MWDESHHFFFLMTSKIFSSPDSLSSSISSSYFLYSSRILTKKLTLPSSVSVSIGCDFPLSNSSYFSSFKIYIWCCSFIFSSFSSYLSSIAINYLFPFSISSISLFLFVSTSFSNLFLVSIWFDEISFWISHYSFSMNNTQHSS